MCYNIQKENLCFFIKYLDDRNIYYFDSTFNFYGIREDLDFVILEIEFDNNVQMLEFEGLFKSKLS